MRLIVSPIFLLVICTASSAQSLVPSDEHSRVEFKIRNFGSTVEGSFKGLQGSILFDPTVLSTARFDISIDANTIDTGIGMRDNHLRKDTYFDVKKYSRIRFVSTKVTPSAKTGEFVITGNLTIKKTTREISFPFTHSKGSIFKGKFQIDRRDYEVGSNSISMANNLTVFLNVMAKK